MIQVSLGFPVRTGDTVRDLNNLYDYLYQMEMELRYELDKPEKAFRLTADAEVRRSDEGIWIGSKDRQNGVNIKFGTGLFLVVDGNEKQL